MGLTFPWIEEFYSFYHSQGHSEKRSTLSPWGEVEDSVRITSPTVNKLLTAASGLVSQIRILRQPNHRKNLYLPDNYFLQAFTECLGVVETGQGRAGELTKIYFVKKIFIPFTAAALQWLEVRATWWREKSLDLDSWGLECERGRDFLWFINVGCQARHEDISGAFPSSVQLKGKSYFLPQYI